MRPFLTPIVVATSLVLLAPTASAAQRPDDRSGPRGPGAASRSESEARGSGAQIIAQERGRRSDRRVYGEVPVAAPATTPVAAPDSFDWRDAGIGAAMVGGLGALVLAGALLVRSGRREPRHA